MGDLTSSPFICPWSETPHQHLSDVAVGLKMRVGDSSRTETLIGDVAVQRFLDVVTKVMFTRQPYSKLLSAYVDKLYSPNPFFWGKIGRHIVRKFRSRPSAKSVACGHDVTFPGNGRRSDHVCAESLIT